MGAELDTLHGYGDPVRAGDIAEVALVHDGRRTDLGCVVILEIGADDIHYEAVGVPGGRGLDTREGRLEFRRVPRRGEVGR